MAPDRAIAAGPELRPGWPAAGDRMGPAALAEAVVAPPAPASTARVTGRFHAAMVAVPGDPNSPHLAADKIRAAVYVAGSIEDAGFTEEHAALLRDALTSAGVRNTVETWPGHHGFAVPDQPVHDPALEERQWETLASLYGERLP